MSVAKPLMPHEGLLFGHVYGLGPGIPSVHPLDKEPLDRVEIELILPKDPAVRLMHAKPVLCTRVMGRCHEHHLPKDQSSRMVAHPKAHTALGIHAYTEAMRGRRTACRVLSAGDTTASPK